MNGILTGKIVAPRRIVLYGVHGIGKTTWAASAPKSILLQTEDGANDLDCHKFPVASSFDEVMTRLQELYEGKHSYQTLVVDSLDWTEKLIHRQLCDERGIKNIEDIGYAKGYVYAIDYWKRFLDALNMIRSERGMTIILVAHSQVVRFEDPAQESYDRFAPQLNKHAAALTNQWADEILFASYKVYSKTSDEGFNRKRTRALGTGERILYTTERPGHVAKNRLGLPDELVMSKDNGYAAFAAYLPKNTEKKETSK